MKIPEGASSMTNVIFHLACSCRMSKLPDARIVGRQMPAGASCAKYGARCNCKPIFRALKEKNSTFFSFCCYSCCIYA